jgi:hypothetical protein
MFMKIVMIRQTPRERELIEGKSALINRAIQKTKKITEGFISRVEVEEEQAQHRPDDDLES